MSVVYVDTSVLTAIAFDEPGADALAARLDEFTRLVSSQPPRSRAAGDVRAREARLPGERGRRRRLDPPGPASRSGACNGARSRIPAGRGPVAPRERPLPHPSPRKSVVRHPRCPPGIDSGGASLPRPRGDGRPWAPGIAPLEPAADGRFANRRRLRNAYAIGGVRGPRSQPVRMDRTTR